MVQCPQRAESNGQRSKCRACPSRYFFAHLTSEANPENRRFFGSLPVTYGTIRSRIQPTGYFIEAPNKYKFDVKHLDLFCVCTYENRVQGVTTQVKRWIGLVLSMVFPLVLAAPI